MHRQGKKGVKDRQQVKDYEFVTKIFSGKVCFIIGRSNIREKKKAAVLRKEKRELKCVSGKMRACKGEIICLSVGMNRKERKSARYIERKCLWLIKEKESAWREREKKRESARESVCTWDTMWVVWGKELHVCQKMEGKGSKREKVSAWATKEGRYMRLCVNRKRRKRIREWERENVLDIQRRERKYICLDV